MKYITIFAGALLSLVNAGPCGSTGFNACTPPPTCNSQTQTCCNPNLTTCPANCDPVTYICSDNGGGSGGAKVRRQSSGCTNNFAFTDLTWQNLTLSCGQTPCTQVNPFFGNLYGAVTVQNTTTSLCIPYCSLGENNSDNHCIPAFGLKVLTNGTVACKSGYSTISNTDKVCLQSSAGVTVYSQMVIQTPLQATVIQQVFTSS